jgi:hypothetical protein
MKNISRHAQVDWISLSDHPVREHPGFQLELTVAQTGGCVILNTDVQINSIGKELKLGNMGNDP